MDSVYITTCRHLLMSSTSSGCIWFQVGCWKLQEKAGNTYFEVKCTCTHSFVRTLQHFWWILDGVKEKKLSGEELRAPRRLGWSQGENGKWRRLSLCLLPSSAKVDLFQLNPTTCSSNQVQTDRLSHGLQPELIKADWTTQQTNIKVLLTGNHRWNVDNQIKQWKV